VLVVSIRARLIFSSLRKVQVNDVVLILDEVQSGLDEAEVLHINIMTKA
jgi:ABC-type iron transport system FetAB ATPase subunit